jgi:hypothetical protein
MHQVYIAGVANRRFLGKGEAIVGHLAQLLESGAAEIEAGKTK